MNWIVFNVICVEIVICYSQESHFWDGEDVHKLFHLWSLPKTMQTFQYLMLKHSAGIKKKAMFVDVSEL